MIPSELFWFVAGAMSGLVINYVTEATFPLVLRRYRLWMLRRKAKKPFEVPAARKLSVGDLAIDWVVLATGSYTPERIRCSYSDKQIPLVREFITMKEDFVNEWKRRAEEGETHLPYNSPTYKLRSFDVGYREIVDGEEIPVLILNFAPTDYFTQLVTDLNVNNPIRERFAATTDLTEYPVPEFASIVGVNINLITRDGYLIITNRNSLLPIAAGKLHTSVGEGLLRPTDADNKGAPDPFRCALRGAQEELGVVLQTQDLEFTAFGVHTTLCQYSLIGWCCINESAEEVQNLYSLAIPKDKWENRRLHFVPCNPTSIARFVTDHREDWFSVGLGSVVLSLFQMGYDKREIERAFSL